MKKLKWILVSLCGIAILVGSIWLLMRPNVDETMVKKTHFTREQYLDFDTAIATYQTNIFSLETGLNPNLASKWVVTPWLDKGPQIGNSFDSLTEFDVSISIEVEKSKLFDFNDKEMRGIGCIKNKFQKVSIDGDPINNETTEFRGCSIYKCVNHEGAWKVSAIFLLDTRSHSYFLRDWDQAAQWLQDEIGPLPENSFREIFLFIIDDDVGDSRK